MKQKNPKKTKIVATMGPACADRSVLKEMLLSGVDVCRLNFSHGKREDHLKTIQTIREIDAECGTHTAILADLQGPKIRIGMVEGNSAELKDGSEIIFTTEECIGTSKKVFLSYPLFPRDVSPGDLVLMDDGKLRLQVSATDSKKEVKLIVLTGGVMSSKKGVNLPDTKVSTPSLTEKDRLDLELALDHRVDWVALSFVRSAQDVLDLKAIIDYKKAHSKVIAKIEKPEAIRNIDEIIRVSDGVMVARGDLGVEVPMETVPTLQKKIIKTCRKYAKPTIVATQMMESMITNFAPTRAEVNDVANAVLDGTDAVMLSGETSVGKYPVEVIRTMSKIVREVEKNEEIYHKEEAPEFHEDRFITDSICFNATRLAQRVQASGIITMTFSGYTAFKISSQRPKSNTFVFTENKLILNQLNLLWGVRVYFYDKNGSTDESIKDTQKILLELKEIADGDLVVNVASTPIEEKGKSNMVKLSYV